MKALSVPSRGSQIMDWKEHHTEKYNLDIRFESCYERLLMSCGILLVLCIFRINNLEETKTCDFFFF